MSRSLLVIGLLSLFVPLQAALAVTPWVRVTPQYLKANPDPIQIIQSHNEKHTQFTVRMRVIEPQLVATRLVIKSPDDDQEVFGTEATISDPETIVRFTIPAASIKNAAFYIDLGGRKVQKEVAEPGARGGTTYEIVLRDFVTQFSAGDDSQIVESEPKAKEAALTQTPSDGGVAINPNGEIRGKLLTSDGKPVAGATVALGLVTKSTSEAADRPADGIGVVTGADGSYRLHVPAPGIYNVWLKKHPDPKMTAAADDGLIVKGGEVTESVLRSVALRRVHGRVVDEAGKAIGDVSVSYRSVARPHSEVPAQSMTANADGSLEFHAPPGRCVLHATQHVPVTEGNPFGVGKEAQLRIEIPADGKADEVFEAERLVLSEKPVALGDKSWIHRSTPGTQVVRQENTGEVKGVVLSPKMVPIAGAIVLRHDGTSVTTNAAGEFQMPAEPKTQFVMYAAANGHHLWSGTPTAGDVLRIVLELK